MLTVSRHRRQPHKCIASIQVLLAGGIPTGSPWGWSTGCDVPDRVFFLVSPASGCPVVPRSAATSLLVSAMGCLQPSLWSWAPSGPLKLTLLSPGFTQQQPASPGVAAEAVPALFNHSCSLCLLPSSLLSPEGLGEGSWRPPWCCGCETHEPGSPGIQHWNAKEHPGPLLRAGCR